MKKQMRQYLKPLCMSAFALLVGCAGDEVGFSADALGQDSYSLLLGDVAPLQVIETERWEPAFAGCEGLLDTVHEYGVAEGQPELVVGLDITRHIVCVDTYASIENELALRSGDDVDSLWLGYVATLQTLEADHADSTNERQTNEQTNGTEDEPNNDDADCVEEQAMAIEHDLRVVYGGPDPQPSISGSLSHTIDLHESDPQ